MTNDVTDAPGERTRPRVLISAPRRNLSQHGGFLERKSSRWLPGAPSPGTRRPVRSPDRDREDRNRSPTFLWRRARRWPWWSALSSSLPDCRRSRRSTCGNTRAAKTRPSPSRQFTSEPARTWCAIHHLRHWSAPSRQRTASIICNQPASKALSTITARLRIELRFGTRRCSQISAQVESVRNFLPVGGRSSHDQDRAGRFANTPPAYLSFTSRHSGAEPGNGLSRPHRPAAPFGNRWECRSADILGGRTFAMRIWLKPDRMAALNISPAQVRQALSRQQLPRGSRSNEGLAREGQSDRPTPICTPQTISNNLVVRQESGSSIGLSDIADVVLGAEDYDTGGALHSQQRARVHGHPGVSRTQTQG